jgi:acetylornithine deacetylase
MSRWASAALEVASGRKASVADPGTCMNIGVINGGTKSNIIAGQAFAHWSARLQPGESNDKFLQEIKHCVPPGSVVDWEVPFSGQPLPAAGQEDRAIRQFCRQSGLPPARPVDFWTEASLFSAAGLPALVLGPGHIAQAHQIDEWVALNQLQRAMEIYRGVILSDG